MAVPALVLVHGRSQQMPQTARRSPTAEAAFVARRKQGGWPVSRRVWSSPALPVVREADVRFPYYGNSFVDAIAEYDKRGAASRPGAGAGRRAGRRARAEAPGPPPSADALILEAAAELGYSPGREVVAGEPDDELVDAWDNRAAGAELDLGPLLRPRLLRSALQ